ncbi:MAG: CPBP family intramembrane glutamic endopeptidase [Candidatus Binatia bacterium]
MSQMQLALLLSIVCVAALAAAGKRPYIDEFQGRPRQAVAAALLTAILALTVFFPVMSFGKAEEIDPVTIWFPSLLTGHAILALFLLLWWRLRRNGSLAAFLHLSRDRWPDKIRYGFATGCIGWLVTVACSGMAAGLFALASEPASPASEISPLLVWMAERPLSQRLTIVAVAMTVEESFFRGFMQPRVGLLVSSVLFTLSHFSYGMPVMIVGVFAISLTIGIAFKRAGDLLPCMVAHGVFDAVQLLVILPWAVRAWSPAGMP